MNSTAVNALAAEPLVISIIEAAALKAVNEVDTPHLRVAVFSVVIAQLQLQSYVALKLERHEGRLQLNLQVHLGLPLGSIGEMDR